jgi:ATP-dependent Clp protease ATP-binding subunit ClpA
MFERFTDRARRVVVLAQEEARMLNHNYIGTEHILLGLAHEGEGVAAKALEALDIQLEAVRQQVEEIIGKGQYAPSGHIPFTPRAKKVLELSLRESLQLGHDYIGTEHILLGLIREGEGVAAHVLVRLGADLDRVREEVIKLVHGGHGEAERAVGPRPSPAIREVLLRDVQSALRSFERRLTAIERHLGMTEGPAAAAGDVAVPASESPPAPASESPPAPASESPPGPASDDPPGPASESPPGPASDDPPAAASGDK